MAKLVEAIQRKFEELKSDEILTECKLKSVVRNINRTVFTQIIAMDNQNIAYVGDPKEMPDVFENMKELDLSSNQLKSWSEIFTILECSPRLEILNLSYNPLYASALFCEPRNSILSLSHASKNSCSCSSLNTCYECNNDLSLAELSFEDENINDDLMEGCKKEHSADLIISSSPADTLLSSQLTTLVLNSTYVPWQRILNLLNYLPSLTTLHTALNSFKQCCDNEASILTCKTLKENQKIFPKITHLFFSDNNVAEWSTVCCLGNHFPSLEYLVLLGNPISSVFKPSQLPSSSGDSSHPNCSNFQKLTNLNLTETEISSWECIDALTWWMPSLLSLRLGKALPVFKDIEGPIARAEVIARMPGLVSYNSTLITDDERERAERDFVRRFGEKSVNERPKRYWDLESQHGKVEPFAHIDLSPKRVVRMRVRFGDQEKWHTCGLRKTICKLKQELCHIYSLEEKEMRSIRLFYIDQGMFGATGPEELRNLSRLLYTYHPEDGDAFELYYNSSESLRKNNSSKSNATWNRKIKNGSTLPC